MSEEHTIKWPEYWEIYCSICFATSHWNDSKQTYVCDNGHENGTVMCK